MLSRLTYYGKHFSGHKVIALYHFHSAIFHKIKITSVKFHKIKKVCLNFNFQPSRSHYQGGHGTGKTGKTGNLVLTFSRQGKHREFCFNTGKIFETQGKYFSVTQGKI